MSARPRTSIVIPTYNHAALLPTAVESALAQTAPVEVVVVDDGSTDDTGALVRARWGERVRYVRQPNAGLGAARNTGIAHATADTLTFLDADDALVPESVARRLAVLDARPDVGWVYSDVFVMDAGGTVTGRCSEEYGYAARRRDGRLFEELLRGNFIPVHAVLVRRACLDAVGTFDAGARAKEDWDLWVRVAHEYPAAYVPEALAYVRRTAGSMMTDRTVMAEATLRAMARIEARYPAEVAGAAADWRRMRAQQYLEIAVSGARSRSRGARLHAVLRAIAVRPVQGAAYRTLARLVAGR